jgi:hypothetical protein
MVGAESVALQAVSEATTLARQALELLRDVRDILKSSDNLRSDLQNFDAYLEHVSEIYKASIVIIGDDGTLSSQLRRRIQDCKEPCEKIVEILIRIKLASPALRYFTAGWAKGDLQRQRSQLNAARQSLLEWTNLIRYVSSVSLKSSHFDKL